MNVNICYEAQNCCGLPNSSTSRLLEAQDICAYILHCFVCAAFVRQNKYTNKQSGVLQHELMPDHCGNAIYLEFWQFHWGLENKIDLVLPAIDGLSYFRHYQGVAYEHI